MYEDSSKTKNSTYIPDSDITQQLKSDLSAGLNVNLPPGRFYVSKSIIIFGYSGVIAGAGKDTTVIEAAQGFKAVTDPLFQPINKLTEIFAIYMSNGDVTFKDMTILVNGDTPAEVHNNPFFGKLTTIDNVIVVAGIQKNFKSGITVTFKNLKITGEVSSDSLSINGKNLVFPVIAIGLKSNKPINLVIKDCEIKNSGSTAIEYGNVFGGSGLIMNNIILNCNSGITMYSSKDPLISLGEITIKNNIFKNIANYPIRNRNTWLSYCFKNNRLDDSLLAEDCQ